MDTFAEILKEHLCCYCGEDGDRQEYLREYPGAPLQSWVWCEKCQEETFRDCEE